MSRDEWTTITLRHETKAELSQYLLPGESWEGFFARLIEHEGEAVLPLTYEQINERLATIDEKLGDKSESATMDSN